MKIYKNIKNFRELKSISREEIANLLDMTVSGYSKIERGEIDLSISKLYKIANILNVEADLILNFNFQSIFNNIENTYIQATNQNTDMKINNKSKHLENHIKYLEEEIENLKKIISKN